MEQQRERPDVAMVISGRTWTPPPPQSPIHGLSMSSWGVKFSTFGGQNNFHGATYIYLNQPTNSTLHFSATVALPVAWCINCRLYILPCSLVLLDERGECMKGAHLNKSCSEWVGVTAARTSSRRSRVGTLVPWSPRFLSVKSLAVSALLVGK